MQRPTLIGSVPSLPQRSRTSTLKYGESEALGLESGCVGIIETGNYAQEVPDEVKALVEEAKKGALEGTLKITSAYGKSTEEVQKMKDWANGTD